MNYAIELLKRELVYETQCRADAIEYLDGGIVSPMQVAEKQTRLAFIESKRLAEERIRQLNAVIDLIDQEWDYLANAPKESPSMVKPAFKQNVV